jgi:hypothetical protein
MSSNKHPRIECWLKPAGCLVKGERVYDAAHGSYKTVFSVDKCICGDSGCSRLSIEYDLGARKDWLYGHIMVHVEVGSYVF